MDAATKKYEINSFAFRCVIRDNEVYLVGDAPEMFEFFGTNASSYSNGIIHRIRKDIGDESADKIEELISRNAEKGNNMRLCYPSARADGKKCVIQMDVYMRDITAEGRICDIIDMDITDLITARDETEKLAAQNKALLEDSPVGFGIYHIRDGVFDLIYTNDEYYHVHCGSREYWDSFKGKDALSRIDRRDHRTIFEEWRRTSADHRHLFDARYRCLGEDDQVHWIRLQGRLVEVLEDGTCVCYAAYSNVDAEKRAEDQAEKLRKKLLDTVASLPTVSVLFNAREDGSLWVQSFSDGFCSMAGCSQDEAWNLYGQSDAFDCVHHEDVETLRENVAAHINDTDITRVVYRIYTRKDVYKWVSVNYCAFRVDDNIYIYAAFTDIDELKSQEKRLEDEYIGAQSLIDSISDIYYMTMRINLTQNSVETLRGMNEMLGLDGSGSYDQIMEQLLESMPRAGDRERCRKVFSRNGLQESFRRGKNVVSMDYIYRINGRPSRWLRASMTLTQRSVSGDTIGFCYVEDIHKNKIIESIMDEVLIDKYDFIASIDADTGSAEIACINERTADVEAIHGGMDYDAIMRDYIKDHVVEEEKEKCVDFMTIENVVKRLDNGEKVSSLFTVMENYVLSYKKLDYYYIDQETRLITMIRTDFTDIQKQQLDQEEKLRLALDSAQQANIAKSEFLSRMSHEIRTPMNAIIGLDTIALKEEGISSAMADHLKKIGISARFLLSLINDILDMSRIESGKMLLKNEPFDFRRLIDSINTIMYGQCRDKGIDYECVINGYTDEEYIGDETKLQQILINILGNSVKFTPRGGKIHFMVEQVSGDGDRVRMRFTVADTGTGISEEYIPHIFDTFSQEDGKATTAYGGSGLGLAISKSLVELMDGRIDVHSIKNMGTDFTVEVTLGLSERKSSWNHVMPVIDSGDLKTLIVDDDVIVCQHTEMVLKQAGIDAEWIDSGAGAITLVQKKHEINADYNLILIDWKMPDMDGIETARRIRKIVGPEVTIIILTAYDWSEIEQQARLAGVNDFMRKPIFASSLLQIYGESRKSSPGKKVKQEKYDFTGKRILLAEDNVINAEIAQKLLEMVGFTVDVAENGVEAIRDFTKEKDGAYSAILMDVRMPFMDGLEATRTIRSIKKKDSRTIPIIAMSANAFDEDIRKSIDVGMNAHLSKPIDADLLYKTLGSLIF